MEILLCLFYFFFSPNFPFLFFLARRLKFPFFSPSHICLLHLISILIGARRKDPRKVRILKRVREQKWEGGSSARYLHKIDFFVSFNVTLVFNGSSCSVFCSFNYSMGPGQDADGTTKQPLLLEIQVTCQILICCQGIIKVYSFKPSSLAYCVAQPHSLS